MNYPNPQKHPSDREYYMFALRIASDFGMVIAVPVVVFVLIGQYLDDLYKTGARYTILAFAVSAVISGLIVYRKARRHDREFRVLNNIEKTDKNK